LKTYTQSELKAMAETCSRKVEQVKTSGNYSDEPFKYFYIDDFLDEQLARDCLANFPAIDAAEWQRANDADIEVKQRTTWKSEFDIPDGLVNAVRILNSSLFLEAMSKVLDINKIVPDPYFTGGGLNATIRGGLLDVHVDGNYHDATGLNRRINALVYLNPDWKPEWGGEFGIYDSKGENCVKRIAPLFNRLVVFDSHDFSFHGLPDPLNFPEGKARRSIILYYYTKEPRPQHLTVVEEPHSALWKKRDLNDKKGNKTRAHG
jgi:Rps23 Pro-64 3,4-dihydroxylase Tpa1-like proline 4-hydroxylase